MSFYETQADSENYFFINSFSSSSIFSHFHRSIEFVYTLRGKTEFFINGTNHVLNENELYFVPSYYVHYNRNVGENEILSLVFSHDFFADFEKSYPSLLFGSVLANAEKNKEIYSFLNDFYLFFRKKNCNIPYIKKQAFIDEFLYRLVTVYPLYPRESKKVDQVVIDILTYINEHYAEELNLTLLSQKYGYCPQHFSSLFNKYVGLSLNSYINNIRLKKALSLINDTHNTKSLTTIAMDCGFKSLATFYRWKCVFNG